MNQNLCTLSNCIIDLSGETNVVNLIFQMFNPDFIYLILSVIYSLCTGPCSLKVWIVDEILGIFFKVNNFRKYCMLCIRLLFGNR